MASEFGIFRVWFSQFWAWVLIISYNRDSYIQFNFGGLTSRDQVRRSTKYVIFGFDLTLVRMIIDNKSLDGQALNKSSLKAARQRYGHQSSENQLAACDNLLFRAKWLKLLLLKVILTRARSNPNITNLVLLWTCIPTLSNKLNYESIPQTIGKMTIDCIIFYLWIS